MAHVVLHWKRVAAFLRKRAPAPLVEPDGRRFSGWVRWMSWGLGSLAAAAICFFAGSRAAGHTFNFTEPGESVLGSTMASAGWLGFAQPVLAAPLARSTWAKAQLA
jgi:hypothetical protein